MYLFIIYFIYNNVGSAILVGEVFTIKHYGFVMYGFSSKLMCLSKPVEKTGNSN